MRWSPSTGSSFKPSVYVALWVGKAWLVPHEVARLGDAGSIPEDDALIATDGLHISLAYLGELRDGDFEKIKLFADMFTKHIQYNGDWPIQDCTNRWQYEYERIPLRIRTVLGTCKPERCKECHHFKTRCPEALPGENAFDTHLHARERTLWHLAWLNADFYRSHGVFKLVLHSPLHRICRGMQKFLRSQVEPCENQFVDDLHLTVGDLWKNVGNHTDSNSTVQSESVPVFEQKAPRNEANGEDTPEPLFKCFMEDCRMPSGHWDRCFNCWAHVCSTHSHMCQYKDPCPHRFCPFCNSSHWNHHTSDEKSSDSDFDVEVQAGSVSCSFDGVCPARLDGCKRMSAFWAKDLQADAAAWKRHVSHLRIEERYAGIDFIATRKMPDGHHQQIQCHVTLLQSETAMKPLTTTRRKEAEEMASQVIEEPMTFARGNPTNVYRDGHLHTTLITFHVQGTTHTKLYRFRNWLVQCLGGVERHRINFQVSVDYVFEADCID